MWFGSDDGVYVTYIVNRVCDFTDIHGGPVVGFQCLILVMVPGNTKHHGWRIDPDWYFNHPQSSTSIIDSLLIRMFLDSWRKPENAEKTYMNLHKHKERHSVQAQNWAWDRTRDPKCYQPHCPLWYVFDLYREESGRIGPCLTSNSIYAAYVVNRACGLRHFHFSITIWF